MRYATVALDPAHDKKSFHCGQALLDQYLHTQAKQDVKRKLSACFVLVNDENRIKGYYTLSSASIERALLPVHIINKLPASYSNLPATLLGRLAVDTNFQGQGLGQYLLLDALKRSYDAVDTIGSMAVVVDPIDAPAAAFYRRYGFVLLPDSGKMFIAMETISRLFQ